MCRTSTYRSDRDPGRRTGSAAVELVFVLPFVMALLLLGFTIAAMTMTRMGLVVSVRNDAWSGRHRPWRSSPRFFRKTLAAAVPGEVCRIFGPTGRWPARAAVAARDRREAPIFLAGLEDDFTPTEYEHAVLAGCWDHKELPFESRDEHRRLEPTRRVYYFYDGPLSFAPFRLMAAFASAESLAGQEGARHHHEQEYRRQQEELERQRQQMLDAIADAQRQIDQLREELAVLESQEPRDEAAIQNVRDQIDRLEHDIQTLEEALSTIEQAAQAAPL